MEEAPAMVTPLDEHMGLDIAHVLENTACQSSFCIESVDIIVGQAY
jgi:hypothetical protein